MGPSDAGFQAIRLLPIRRIPMLHGRVPGTAREKCVLNVKVPPPSRGRRAARPVTPGHSTCRDAVTHYFPTWRLLDFFELTSWLFCRDGRCRSARGMCRKRSWHRSIRAPRQRYICDAIPWIDRQGQARFRFQSKRILPGWHLRCRPGPGPTSRRWRPYNHHYVRL